MNRRNFILGLGTAATLSGAASVTGASITEQVEPTANFQVVAEQQLEVQKNDQLSDSTMNSNGNYSRFLNFDDNSTTDFAPTAADDGDKQFPNLTIDNGTNGELDLALATNNSNVSYNRNGSAGFPSGTPYSTADDPTGIPPLQIVNPGDSVDVAVEYQLDDNRSETEDGIDVPDLATDIFSFVIVDADTSNPVEVSPDNGDSYDTGTQVISSGSDEVANIDTGTTDVHLELNYSEEIADKLAAIASGGGALDFGGTSQVNVPLLDEVRFGVDN
jgi:hypothetical protein